MSRNPSNVKHMPPNANGLSVVDCTGVQIGNSDIEASSIHSPPTSEPERPTLPGCEHQVNLPEDVA